MTKKKKSIGNTSGYVTSSVIRTAASSTAALQPSEEGFNAAQGRNHLPGNQPRAFEDAGMVGNDPGTLGKGSGALGDAGALGNDAGAFGNDLKTMRMRNGVGNDGTTLAVVGNDPGTLGNDAGAFGNDVDALGNDLKMMRTGNGVGNDGSTSGSEAKTVDQMAAGNGAHDLAAKVTGAMIVGLGKLAGNETLGHPAKQMAARKKSKSKPNEHVANNETLLPTLELKTNIKPLPFKTPSDTANGVSLSMKLQLQLLNNPLLIDQDDENVHFKSGSKFDLETTYVTLLDAGFSQDQVQTAMTLCGCDVHAAFNWMCLQVDPLPVGWDPEAPKIKIVVVAAALPPVAKKTSGGAPKTRGRDIIMVDDMEREQFESVKLEREKAQEMKATQIDLASAKIAGNDEEIKRLGRKLGFLMGSVSKRTLDGEDSEQAVLQDKATPQPSLLSDDSEQDLGMSVFDQDSETTPSATSAKFTAVTYGAAHFEGSIDLSSWKGATPKTLLSQALKRQFGMSSEKYTKGKEFWSVQIPSSQGGKTFESRKKANSDDMEQEYVAIKALYALFPETQSTFHVRLPPAFRQEWLDWVREDALREIQFADAAAKPRREFVDRLLREHSDEFTKTSTLGDSLFKPNTTRSTSFKPRKPITPRKETVTSLRHAAERMSHATSNRLPIWDVKEEFLNRHSANDYVVVVAETGSGKTTQIPQMLAAFYGPTVRIAISEPRRVSAVSVSRRVGEELGDSYLTAYQIRGENTMTDRALILFCTTGILLNRAVDDVYFKDFDVVVVDEVHERTLDSDVLMILLKDAVKARKNSDHPLKVVLMSATIDSDKLCKYFDNAPLVRASGRTFPVDFFYLEDLEDQVVEDELTEPSSQALDEGEAFLSQHEIDYAAMEKVLLLRLAAKTNEQDSSALVFLPGLAEINKAKYQLLDSKEFSDSNRYVILTLHSGLSGAAAAMQELFEPPPPGMKKIVLSTNVAETGVTIPDITCVVDTCRVNQITFNEKKALVTLKERFVSKASAQQRAGRAGRVRPGVCYRLVTRKRYSKFRDFTLPEINRVPLDGAILRVVSARAGGGDVDPLTFFAQALDPPLPSAVNGALKRLQLLGCCRIVDGGFGGFFRITPLGKTLSRLGIDPRIGKMLVTGVLFRCWGATASVAAAASAEKSVFLNLEGKRGARFARMDSDLITEARAFEDWSKANNRKQFARDNGLDLNRLREMEIAREQLLSILINEFSLNNTNGIMSDEFSDDGRVLRAVLAAGLQVASVEVGGGAGPQAKFVCAGDGVEARLVKTSVAYGAASSLFTTKPGRLQKLTKYCAFSERIRIESQVYLSDATPVEPAALMLLAAGSLKVWHAGRRVDLDDGWTHVKCLPRTAALFCRLRDLMNRATDCFFESNRNPEFTRDVVNLIVNVLRNVE